MVDKQHCSLDKVYKELAAIEAKYHFHGRNNIERKLSEEMTDDLNKLSEEFDTLGIARIEINNMDSILDQLLQNSYQLIQMYRRKVKEISDFHLRKRKQETLRLHLNEDIDCFKSEISMRDDQIKKLENEMNKLKSDYDEKTNKNKKLTTQLTQIKAAYKSKLKEHEHVSQQLQNKIESLKEKCGESIGKYKSSDSFLMEYLLKYKAREEIYKETISKLQQNNRELMEEVLNLKQDIVFHDVPMNESRVD